MGARPGNHPWLNGADPFLLDGCAIHQSPAADSRGNGGGSAGFGRMVADTGEAGPIRPHRGDLSGSAMIKI